MHFPGLKCIISSFSSLPWANQYQKERKSEAGQKKLLFQAQASKSKFICKCSTSPLQTTPPCDCCPLPYSQSTQDDQQILQEVTKPAILLMHRRCQRPRVRPDPRILRLEETSELLPAQWFSNCVLHRIPARLKWNPCSGEGVLFPGFNQHSAHLNTLGCLASLYLKGIHFQTGNQRCPGRLQTGQR